MIYWNGGETGSSRMSDSERKELEKVKKSKRYYKKEQTKKESKTFGQEYQFVSETRNFRVQVPHTQYNF